LKIKKKFFGVQFHPEVTHTENGKKIISNFIFKICKIKKNWSSKDQKIKLIKEVRNKLVIIKLFVLYQVE
jgi:GMP synthase (glutamine-hydrolysing)